MKDEMNTPEPDKPTRDELLAFFGDRLDPDTDELFQAMLTATYAMIDEVIDTIDNDAIEAAQNGLELLGINTDPEGDPFNASLPLHMVRVALWNRYFADASQDEMSNVHHEAMCLREERK
jgi:hypothetical protein